MDPKGVVTTQSAVGIKLKRSSQKLWFWGQRLSISSCDWLLHLLLSQLDLGKLIWLRKDFQPSFNDVERLAKWIEKYSSGNKTGDKWDANIT